MTKEARRATIVEAAVSLVQSDGLQAVTVRGVAQALGVSPGQIHHHFGSADELRAEAFREFWQSLTPQFLERAEAYAGRDKLAFLLLGSGSDTDRLAKRLWKEALNAARMDVAVGQAVRVSLEEWYRIVTDAVMELKDGSPAAAALTARRLLALVLGADFLVDMGVVAQSDEELEQIVRWGIRQEIGEP